MVSFLLCSLCFISIHALRGEGDVVSFLLCSLCFISIHALRGEGDDDTVAREVIEGKYFNPRPPWGGRLNQLIRSALGDIFQSTPSVGRATLHCSDMKVD